MAVSTGWFPKDSHSCLAWKFFIFCPFAGYRYTSRNLTNGGDTWQHHHPKRTQRELATRLPVNRPPL